MHPPDVVEMTELGLVMRMGSPPPGWYKALIIDQVYGLTKGIYLSSWPAPKIYKPLEFLGLSFPPFCPNVVAEEAWNFSWGLVSPKPFSTSYTFIPYEEEKPVVPAKESIIEKPEPEDSALQLYKSHTPPPQQAPPKDEEWSPRSRRRRAPRPPSPPRAPIPPRPSTPPPREHRRSSNTPKTSPRYERHSPPPPPSPSHAHSQRGSPPRQHRRKSSLNHPHFEQPMYDVPPPRRRNTTSNASTVSSSFSSMFDEGAFYEESPHMRRSTTVPVSYGSAFPEYPPQEYVVYNQDPYQQQPNWNYGPEFAPQRERKRAPHHAQHAQHHAAPPPSQFKVASVISAATTEEGKFYKVQWEESWETKESVRYWKSVNPKYKVEQTLEWRFDENGVKVYRTRWKPTWEPESEVQHEEAVRQFLRDQNSEVTEVWL